jgi:hypothetical protein
MQQTPPSRARTQGNSAGFWVPEEMEQYYRTLPFLSLKRRVLEVNYLDLFARYIEHPHHHSLAPRHLPGRIRNDDDPVASHNSPKDFFLNSFLHPKNKKNNHFIFPFHGTLNIISSTITSQHTNATLRSSITLLSRVG